MTASIEIGGLREFQKALREMDRGLPKQIRVVLNEAADLIIDYARPKIPRKTGAAAASLKARSNQRTAGIAVGGRRAPYYPWLDFGGQGRRKGRPASREFKRGGRYVYPGLEAKRKEVTDLMSEGLAQLAKDNGVEVS